ncbi:hypothetical protein BH23PLA1_BH23PLA1_04780 [soil metagenome]
MIRTAWASAPMSFLIVATAAVALFEPEPMAGTPSQGLQAAGLDSGEPPVAPAPLVFRPLATESHSLAIAIVGPLGESLVDVTLRVYGRAEALPTLWEANRDRVEDPEALLPPGTVLRMP